MFVTQPTDLVVNAVVRVLSNHLGDFMARSTVEVQRDRLGLSPDRLSSEDVDLLLQRVALALELFVGTERSRRVVTAARAEIAGVSKS